MSDRSETGAAEPKAATACCVPSEGRERPVVAGTPTSVPSRRQAPRDAVPIPGGSAEVGTDRPVLAGDGEGPRRHVRVRPFLMDASAVTNDRFAAFVAETGYVTEAERFGWSFVFRQLVPGDVPTAAVVGAPWWRKVDGADWRHPDGPWSDLEGRSDLPVVHVSWADADSFATWAGGRLPTEAEWEHAARGGLIGKRFSWGDDEPDESDFLPCNIWQGRFPNDNTAADGHAFLAPARSYTPNGYGLFNCLGNAWEWTADAFRVRSLNRQAKANNARAQAQDLKVLKGGSYLCHVSYCYRYRIAARIGNPADTATGHIGFRCVYGA